MFGEKMSNGVGNVYETNTNIMNNRQMNIQDDYLIWLIEKLAQ